MAATEPRKPRRRWRIALAIFAMVVIAVVLAIRHYTRTDRLTALIIGEARSALGADLTVGGTAHYDFWPTLHLVLAAPSLNAPNASAFIKADAIEVRVPWRILWADRYDIEQIDVIRPVLDLDALKQWLATRPASNASTPDIRFNLHLIDGNATSGGMTVAEGLDIAFTNSGDLAAWIDGVRAHPDSSALVPPLNGSADAKVLQIGTTRLEGVHLEVKDDVPPPASHE
ncbi:MAG: AsmA family protein [Dokdonella sp.]|uniref:AsmA family protein n=1 Tax=Dokdonella sp. TaxID=2291710 RepID=UPI003265AC5B